MVHARNMLHRARAAWQEVVQSMSGVEANSLLSNEVSVRVRVPAVHSRGGAWLDFMGRPCFLDALDLVAKQLPGQRVCITGARGSGKGYLMGALAAVLACNQTDAAVVHMEAEFFMDTPLYTLLLGLFVAFGRDEAAVGELAAIETWDDAVHWMKQRQEKFYFFIGTADVFVVTRPSDHAAISLLSTAADAVGAVVIYASAAPLCLGETPASVFLVPAFNGKEMRSFLGAEPLEIERFWSCTGGVPALMKSYSQGNAELLKLYYSRAEVFFRKKLADMEWEVVFMALSGCHMTPSDAGFEEAVLKVMGGTGCLLFRNNRGFGECLVDALTPRLSFQSLQVTSLNVNQVLQIWLMPVVNKSASGSGKAWNCLMAIATLVRLRMRVDLLARP